MLSIQPADPIAIPLIQQLAFEIWPAAYRAILRPGQLEYMLKMIYSEEALAAQMKEGQQFFIAYDNGAPVGFVAFGPYSTNIYKLHKIYVLPKIQGQGTGKQLLQLVINKVKEYKAESLILNVNRQNQALHFYEKQASKSWRK